MTSLGILGAGVLGKACFRGFVEHADVRLYDIVREKSTHSLEEVATAEIVFICLPTNALPDGRCDTSLIDNFLAEAYGELWWKPESCFVVRSTVPIGFTQSKAALYEYKLPIFHSPEFLTARFAYHDFQVPARNIIGAPFKPEVETIPQSIAWFRAASKLKALYRTRFPGVTTYEMPSNSSELVKLACNTFFASKVTLFNMFAEISAAAGVEWEQVRDGILSDGRIAHAHTQVTANPPGFGGSCLPKDVADLYTCGKALGVDMELIREVLQRNDRIRREFDPGLTRIELAGPMGGY